MLAIAAGEASAVQVARGRTLRIVNTQGGQVVDTWAFAAQDYREHLSMSHSRSALYRLLFEIGDTLVSSAFAPMLTIVDDTSPGIHDTLHAACSAASYEFYGHGGGHPNCEDNLLGLMRGQGKPLAMVPCPWNLFEHAVVVDGNHLRDEPSATLAGQYVELRAEMDLLVVCSACPSTVGQISGDAPRGAGIELLEQNR